MLDELSGIAARGVSAVAGSDEVLYYCSEEFMSRKGIEHGSVTLHPDGMPHGPHPGKAEASMGKSLGILSAGFRAGYHPAFLNYSSSIPPGRHAVDWSDALGTDPYNTDSDGDGVSDGDEVDAEFTQNGQGLDIVVFALVVLLERRDEITDAQLREFDGRRPGEWPGDSTAVETIGPVDGGKDQRAIGDAAAHRADLIHAPTQGHGPVAADAAKGRTQRRDPAAQAHRQISGELYPLQDMDRYMHQQSSSQNVPCGRSE